MRGLLDKPWKKLLVFLVIFSFVGLAAQEPPKQGGTKAAGAAASNPCSETQAEITNAQAEAAEAETEASEAETEVADYKAELSEEQNEGNCSQ